MILIALGSNLSGPWGSPRDAVLRAITEMPDHNIRVQTVSSLIETAPFGVTNQPNFVNAVARIKTQMTPEQLLQALHTIEKGAGRKRAERWGPRTLDLDILDYNGQVSTETNLTLPHPGIAERSFVLAPIAEIAPRWKHPLTQKTAALMLRQLNGLSAN